MDSPESTVDICYLAEQDFELNGADDEFESYESGSDSDGSLSLGSTAGDEVEKEFNLNCSFTGGYLPNTDISRVDKGLGNP